MRRGEDRVVFTFDSAVHDISGVFPTGPVHSILGRLGLNELLQWRRVSHEYCFPFATLPVDENHAEYLERLKNRFPAEAAGLERLFSILQASYEELSRYATQWGACPCAEK